MTLENTREHHENRSREPGQREPRLDELVAEIGQDARIAPADYLRESLVPEGGE